MNFSNPYSRDLGVFTWAELQAAYPNGGGALAALPTGVRAFVGDLGHEFVPNTAKTRWTPSGGSFVLRSNGGSVANPIASMTGVTSGSFSIPGGMPTIPSALLDQGDSIFVRGRVFKTGANATAKPRPSRRSIRQFTPSATWWSTWRAPASPRAARRSTSPPWSSAC